MNRSHWLLVAGVLVLAVAGVSAYATPAGRDAPSSPRSLDVSPADGNGTANETVAFETLSPGQQDVFGRARNTTGAVEIPSGVADDVFTDHRYVRYRNRTYEVVVAVP